MDTFNIREKALDSFYKRFYVLCILKDKTIIWPVLSIRKRLAKSYF